MTSPSDPSTGINTTFEALQWEFDDEGVCYIASGSLVFVEDFEDGDEIWDMGSTTPYISAGGTTPVMGLVYNDSEGTWALHGNIVGNDGDILRININHNGSSIGEYVFFVIAPFPSPGTPENPLTSLTITGRDLAKEAINRTFYLTQGATVNITGWYNDGQDYWFDRNDPAPGHNIERRDILNANEQWEGYLFTSPGVTNIDPAMSEAFYLTYHKKDVYTNVQQNHVWTFWIVADSDAGETSPYAVKRGSGINILKDEQIFMSDLDNVSQYLIYQSDSDYNCVESYTIYGGSEQPFEYVKLTINKKQLSVLAPELVDYIIPGRNIITLFGPGQGEYVVTKCSKSKETWTVIAYALMEQIRGLIISSARYLYQLKPMDMIVNLVRSTPNLLSVSGSNPLNLIQRIDFVVKESNNHWKDTGGSPPLCFDAGVNVWYAIQVCALRLNAKVWMADGVLYVVDTSLTAEEAADPNKTDSSLSRTAPVFNDIGTIYLNSEGGFPICPTEFQTNIMNNVIGIPELGEDGCEVIRNMVVVTYSGNAKVASKTSGNPARSQGAYNMKMHSVNIPQIGGNDAQDIANLMANRYCDAETSISFSMAEVVEETEIKDGVTTVSRIWKPFFQPLTRIERIVDFVNETTVSITSNLDLVSKFYNKGMLSLYEIELPQHVTKYTFGVSTPTDITQNNSVILNAINNG